MGLIFGFTLVVTDLHHRFWHHKSTKLTFSVTQMKAMPRMSYNKCVSTGMRVDSQTVLKEITSLIWQQLTQEADGIPEEHDHATFKISFL